jgi:hypothetical protein
MLIHVQSSSGNWERGGEEVEMVKQNSALLYWPGAFEDRVPTDRNHTDMVKFGSSADNNYQTVVAHLTTCLDNIGTTATHILKDSNENTNYVFNSEQEKISSASSYVTPLEDDI